MLLPPNDSSPNLSSEAIPQPQPNVTLDTIIELAEKLKDMRPKIYYGLSTAINPGESFLVHATGYYPQFFVCHPDDLGKILAELTAMHCIPLSEYKPVWPGLA